MSRSAGHSEQIIELVKKRAALYDHNAPGNNNPVRRKALWEEVGAELFADHWNGSNAGEKEALVKELQVKWKSMRDTYNRIRKAEREAELKGTPTKNKRKYIFYDQLSFLDGILMRRSSPNTIFLQEQNDSMDTFLAGSENSNPLKDEDCFEATSSTIARNADDSGPSVGDRVADLLQEVVALQKEDRSDDRMGNKKFLLSLLPFLEKLPDDVNLEVRLQLMSVIHTYSTSENFMKIV